MARLYTKDHEWIDVAGKVATVGITDYAQAQLGDVVFVDLPDPGRAVTKGGDAAVVESVKVASDVFSPVTGTIAEANQALADTPALVNEAPEGDGWFFKVEIADEADLGDLMDADAYAAYTASL
ncbi:glycine cleavage system protein GcvH [Chthonobacter rhizosphaerae]|uniref:glycine cleavage system protein GcvH n=1 Tax=Chthonobacter rhizosphaerae TaxID=2735553 RepID=UPI0015EF8EF1|nr:glycine cleavage system protein GcvH [Chthonobacter rhizosphaerae]